MQAASGYIKLRIHPKVNRLTSAFQFLNMWSYIFLFAFQVFSIQAGTVNLDWSIDWINISPDGFSRPAPGINGQWPLPSIYVNIGDRLIINLTNNLQNETTTIHFHGIHQNGTNQMDGPGFVTQCPIPPGGSESPSILSNTIC